MCLNRPIVSYRKIDFYVSMLNIQGSFFASGIRLLWGDWVMSHIEIIFVDLATSSSILAKWSTKKRVLVVICFPEIMNCACPAPRQRLPTKLFGRCCELLSSTEIICGLFPATFQLVFYLVNTESQNKSRTFFASPYFL